MSRMPRYRTVSDLTRQSTLFQPGSTGADDENKQANSIGGAQRQSY